MNTKRNFYKSLLTVLLLLVVISGRAQTPAQTATSTSPGPPLWKVSSGDHVLWIFATLTPLQTGINWRSEEVESVIGQAQEYIYFKMPEPSIPANPFKLINGLRLVLQIRNNPEGKLLQEVIPAELYARLMSLVDRYQIPDMEKTRPYYAADSLRGYAVISSKLTEDHGVDLRLQDLVSARPSLTLTPISLGPDRLDYDFLVNSAQRMSEAASLEEEVRCLKLSVDSVETDIGGMQLRARAWATGNVEALRQNQDLIDAKGVCERVLLTGKLLDDASAEWLSAAETALTSKATSFAVLELDELLAANGLLEKLKARGYTITEP
jgi:hypothetical protein